MSGDHVKHPESSEAAQWRRVWLKAIARAWRHPEFEQSLLQNPSKALAEAFGYTLPVGIHLKVVKVMDDDKHGWTHKGWSLPPVELTVPLPPKPSHIEDHALAISELFGAESQSCSDTCCF